MTDPVRQIFSNFTNGRITGNDFISYVNKRDEKINDSGFLDRKCPNEDTCHNECEDGICTGPTAQDCIKCKNYHDLTYLNDINSSEIYRETFTEGNFDWTKSLANKMAVNNTKKSTCVAKCPERQRFQKKLKCIKTYNKKSLAKAKLRG